MKRNIIGLAAILLLCGFAGNGPTTPSVQKPRPVGIMLLMGGQLYPNKSIGNHPALAHANVDGMRVKSQWGVIEATEGAPNWTPFDQAIALAKSVGKKISISVNAGGNVPAWLWTDGAQSYPTKNGSLAAVPDDPVFLSKWTRFISEFGARYDANPTVSYVVVTGIGDVVEWYRDDSEYLESLSPPNPPGTAKWIAGAEAIIDAFAAAFPTTPFFGALANPYGETDGLTAEKTVVDWAVTKYPGRFGVMTNTLCAHSTTNFYPDFAVNEYRSTQPNGFQMLWSQTADSGKRDGCCCMNTTSVSPDPNALDESLTAGVKIGGHFVEVYESDCNNSALQATITSHQAQFKALP